MAEKSIKSQGSERGTSRAEKAQPDDWFAARILADLPFRISGASAGDGAVPHTVSFGPGNTPQPTTEPFFVTPDAQEEQNWPAVATDGAGFLVVWTQKAYQTELWGARISAAGKVLDPKGFLINVGGFHRFPRLAFGKDPKSGKGYYLVVWQRFESSNGRHEVHGALVRASDGQVSVHLATMTPDPKSTYGTSPLELSMGGSAAVKTAGTWLFPDIDGHWNPWQEHGPWVGYGPPDVAFNGTHFVIVSDGLARLVEPGTGKLIRGTKKDVVYPLGNPRTFTVANWQKSCYSLRIVAGKGGECLVTWVDGWVKPRESELWAVKAKFATASATVGKPFLVSKQAQAPYGNCEAAGDGNGHWMLAWHDMALAQQKKVKPSDTWAPDLFRAHLSSPTGKPLSLVAGTQGVYYMKKDFMDYRPQVAFDGANYVVVWHSGGTYLKKLWMIDKLGATWLEPEVWPQWDFWDQISESERQRLTMLLDCMNDFTLLGSYLSTDGYPVDNFGIFGRDQGVGYSGLIGYVGGLSFGGQIGLMVYRWLNTDAWDTKHPHYLIRVRLLARSPKTLVADWKKDVETVISPERIKNLKKA